MAGAWPGGADAFVQQLRRPLCGLRRMLSLVHAAHRSVNVVKKPGTRVLNVGSYVHFNILQPCLVLVGADWVLGDIKLVTRA